ncbi:hypothetical protein AVEN_37232-1 [Araneus ventricosus]|uniref:Uncharacterized protein n=1 Tax=Araneus ventricosus TaxID=182803 RepID=A0A4Y2MR17_ARAVE|nr:hypothetical protein AVEN_37232-1 [Araneus ventricosus]
MMRTTPELASPSKLSESAVVEGIWVDILNLILQYENNIEGMISVSKAESEIWKPRDLDTQKWRILQISIARLKMYLQLRPVVAALHKRALTSSNFTDFAVVPTGVSSKPLSRKIPS